VFNLVPNNNRRMRAEVIRDNVAEEYVWSKQAGSRDGNKCPPRASAIGRLQLTHWEGK
jgi:hypothetical protein